jgi:hypothetical protein
MRAGIADWKLKVVKEPLVLRTGVRGILLLMAVFWLGFLDWHAWQGVNPIHAALGNGILTLAGGLVSIVLIKLSRTMGAIPLAITMFRFDNAWLHDSTLAGVTLTAVRITLGSFVMWFLVGLIFLRRPDQASKTNTRPAMWDSDADRPLLSKEPI